MRFVLEVSYKGTRYQGWQIQENANSVQAEINKAIGHLIILGSNTLGSGRTDAGVHAEQQFVQFDCSMEKDQKYVLENSARFLYQVNAILPQDIYAKNIYVTPKNFSVRHDAIERSYEYRICRHKNPFLENICAFYFYKNIDLHLLNELAVFLTKQTDYQSFSKYHTDVNHYNCTIKTAFWEERDGLLIFTITADRFLRGMVRALVGTMLETATGKITKEEFYAVFKQKDRQAAKFSVKPEGLFLTNVIYKEGAMEWLCNA